MAVDVYADGVDFRTAVLVVTGFFGMAFAVLVPVLLLLAVSNGRERRWVARHRLSACAALRPGVRLPRRLAVYGRTVPGRDGLVVTPLSGAEGVWFRTMVYRQDTSDGNTRTSVLWEASGGETFGVADDSGVAAVSAQLLQASTFNGHLSMWARTRNPVASASPVERPVDEMTGRWGEPGPWLRQVIERGLIAERAVKGAERIGVVEEVVPARVPLHVIGEPGPLSDGSVGLTLPRTGRYLLGSRAPAETEQALRGDSRYGLGCAVWAALAGAGCLAVAAAVASSLIQKGV